MRSYANLILVSGIFDTLNNSDSEVVKFADKIFNPTVELIEQDCQTTIGEIRTVDFSITGNIEVVTNQVIDSARVTQLLSQGIYQVGIRNTSTCIAHGGVCQADYGDTTSPVGSHITLNTTNRLPFLSYLAKSYSGALIGIEPALTQNLPIRSGLYNDLIIQSELDRISQKILNNYLVPKTYRDYYKNILESLEKALYLIALYQLFIT